MKNISYGAETWRIQKKLNKFREFQMVFWRTSANKRIMEVKETITKVVEKENTSVSDGTGGKKT